MGNVALRLFSRASPTLNLPCISPQNSVTCNGEYRRPFIKAQPSFHDVEVDGKYVDNFSTLKHIDPHTIRGRSAQKDGVCNEHIFRNGSFRELKIAEESNVLADLAKVLPESYQKSNEFSVNGNVDRTLLYRRQKHLLTYTDDRRTFTNKDKVRRIQTLGNGNKDAMLDCESRFHRSEDKRKLNCHKLRSSYVTSIFITKITFAMFLSKLSTLSAAIFLFVSLVL